MSSVIPADTITAANGANTAKEKALADVSALKLEAERQHAAFEEEWKQLTRFIEDDRCVLVLITARGASASLHDSQRAAME
jgi:translation initiation factor IF-3